VAGPVTLQGLASQINATKEVPVSASVIETAPERLSSRADRSRESGLANAFTVQNALTGSTVAFTDDAVEAQNAEAQDQQHSGHEHRQRPVLGDPRRDGDARLRGSNPDGRRDRLSADDESLSTRIEAFVTAFNDVTAFAKDQKAQAGKGTPGTLGHDAMLRSLHGTLCDRSWEASAATEILIDSRRSASSSPGPASWRSRRHR
jgi:hypothetical protein